MKKNFKIFLIIFCLVSMFFAAVVSKAFALDKSNKFDKSAQPLEQKTAKLTDKMKYPPDNQCAKEITPQTSDYRDPAASLNKWLKNDRCSNLAVRFTMSKPLSLQSGYVLEIKNSNQISIDGLKLSLNNESVNDLFTIKGSPNAKFLGSNIEITSFLDKEKTALVIAVQGATLDNVNISKFSEGVRVEADNVMISNSAIYDNNTGIHILNNVKNTDIEHTLIYDSVDLGIKIDDKLEYGIVFMKNEKEPMAEDKQEMIYLDKAYLKIKVPDNVDPAGKIEFYSSNEKGLSLAYMSGEFSNPIAIDSALLQNGKLNFTLPPQYRDRLITAVYTNSALGTSGFSKAFKVTSKEPIVAFVQSPYEIPSPGDGVKDGAAPAGVVGGPEPAGAGGVADKKSDSGEGSGGGTPDDETKSPGNELGGGSLGGGDSVVEAAGGLVTTGSGMQKACSLVAKDTFRTVSWEMNLWWIIFATSLLSGVRGLLTQFRRP